MRSRWARWARWSRRSNSERKGGILAEKEMTGNRAGKGQRRRRKGKNKKQKSWKKLGSLENEN